MVFRYEIDGTTYVQKKLVWGQVLQTLGVLRGADLATASGGMMGLLAALGPKAPELVAVALVAEGQSAERDADQLAALAAKLAAHPEIMLAALRDFFTCNPVASLAESLRGVIETVGASLIPTSPKPSKTPSASLPTATSPSAASSYGDALRKKAGLT